ncbi:Clp protease ClpP [Paenibacillus sp. F411]|uniref:head maturation protease, ClpP-related n=1 Tax=Paenibacillus sp. F411 TaxID=2820239 RepID=UPI001AAE4D0A|nr:head maturation protease, ClpP-related [Paenibacillus sp. F411]MBO2943573.1 Clp protease ClpP [Paenibacillus sp. F411]
MPKKIKLNGPVIGDGSAWLYDWVGIPYISASRLSKELDNARGDDVELYINSPGGMVFAGSEVYTLLKEYTGKVTAKVTGVAASAASFFLMAADEIKMSPTSQLMIHNARNGAEGDKNVHYSNADMLSGTDVSITNAYRLKTGKNMDELLELMNKTTWMNAQEAVSFGFADGILFDEENTLMTVTNSISGEIPPDVEAKLRDVLISAMLKDGSKYNDRSGLFAGLDLSSIMPQITNSIENQNEEQQESAEPQNKEEKQPMKLEELKAQHPDLYNEVVNLGVTQERGRITELNALATAPGAAEIVAKAISEGKTAGETAMEIVKASAERVANEGTRRNNDAQNSGVGNVDSDEAPGKPDPEAVSKAEADALTAEINNMIGGRK